MLLSLTLTNFQKHRAFHHDFKPGLTLIVGENWAGKSSLVRGVLYALFGTSAVPVRAANLVTWGEKRMEVQLVFRANDQVYRVVRGSAGATLFHGEHVVASGQTPVTGMVQELIGDARSFLTYQVAKQGEADGLLSLGAVKLAQHIYSVTGVDLVDKVLERIRMRRMLYAGMQENYDTTVTDIEGMEAELVEHEKALAGKQVTSQEMGKELDLTQDRYSVATGAWRKLMQSKEDHRAYLNKLEIYRNAKQRADTLLAEANHTLNTVPVSDLGALRNRYADLTKHYTFGKSVEEKLTDMEKEVANAKKNLALFEGVATFVEEPEGVHTNLLNEGRTVAHLQELLDAAREGIRSGICPTCLRPLGDEETHLDLEQQAEELDQKLAEHKGLLNDLNDAWSQYQQQAEIAHTAHTNKEAWKSYLETCERGLQEARDADRTRLHVTEEGLEQAYADYQKADEDHRSRESAMRDRLRAKKELTDLGQAPSPVLEVSPHILSTATTRMQELGGAQNDLRQQIAVLEAEMAMLAKTIALTTQSLTKSRERRDQFLEKIGEDALLAKLAKYLRDNRSRFTQQAWASLLGYASQFIAAASQGHITALLRSSYGDFSYVEEGNELPLELASGQQTAILGVAMKLALGAAVGSRFDVLLLDEVTAAASDNNALRLTACLAQTGQQVLMVSHREADAAVAQDVIAL